MKENHGLIAISSLLIITVVVLFLSVSASLLGVSQINSSFGFTQGQLVEKAAEGCGEEALLVIRDFTDYTGGNLTVGQVSCTINVVSNNNLKTISITAEKAGPPRFVKRLTIVAKKAGNSLNIVSWQRSE